MNQKKSLLRILLPWAIAAALIAALVIFVGIPLYAPQEEEVLNPPVISFYEDGKQTLTMENDSLLFEMDAETTHFKLTEKATGREWLSNPADAAQDKIAVSTNKAVLQSTMIVTYSSSSGTIDFNNYQYSIENGNYTIEQMEDGAIRVCYSVGKIEKIYLLPTITTVERMTMFTEAMSSKDAKKVKNVYTLYKPEKVAEREDKDELLAMYPELATQEMYVLKADTSESNKKKIAGYFESAGYTQADFDLDQQFVAGSAESTNAVFNVSIIYRLDGDDFVVEVPYDEMRYRAEYPITYVTVLPMFGAAGVDEEGFMFIPEGGGALINYNNGKLNQNSYYANLYGWDYGSERTEVVNETQISFPVFGMTKGGGSFICIMEEASVYGGVQADISMRYNSYNWACAKYNVLHSDRYNVSAKTAQLVYMFEKTMPDATIVQRYRFVDSDNYVDMAAAYGEYLREKHPELVKGGAAEEMPVSVELLGAIDKTVVKWGMPVDSVVATTTFDDAAGIIDKLLADNVKNLNVRFSGWSNGGVSQKVLNRVRIQRQLGGKDGMAELISYAKSRNVPLYFDGISCFAYRSGILQGFIPYRDAARFTTREQIQLYPYSVVTYLPADYFDPYYLVQPGFAREKASNLIEALAEQNAYGVAFRDIGSLLSADYNPKNTTTREQVKQMNLETIQQAHDAGQSVMVKKGFDYVLPYVELVTDVNLKGTKYSIIDQSVPFYQIAIHGMVDYTGQPINLSADWQTELLRCAEYGAGLNFTFMEESGIILQETNYSGYYGASFADWGKDAVEIINAYQQDMAGLNQQMMISHEILDRYVTVTGYENGTLVYVNYGADDYSAGEVLVPARSYLVVGRDQQ
ncbi:MAG: hypothetical protein IKK75_15800 [Clostridia bacterium]|nr:hypothetical protein [Clostridia bacterium]